MLPENLSEEELLALVGLAKLVVRADHELSPEESTRLRALATAVGPTRWHGAVVEAGRQLRTEGQARQCADRVKRPEAQTYIYERLCEVAAGDGVAEQEREVISWLGQRWNLEPPL